MVKQAKNKYWFKAKHYGWGWTPCSWEGWLVIFLFISFVMVLSFSEVNFVFGIFLLLGILLFICFKKGEKPGWRWGNKK